MFDGVLVAVLFFCEDFSFVLPFPASECCDTVIEEFYEIVVVVVDIPGI